MDTKLRNSSDYSGVIQGLLGGKVDVVLSMSPSSYASVYLNNPKAVDIVGIAVDDKDQSRGYHSVVIVKSRLPVQNAGRFKRQSLRLRRSGFHFRVSDP
ncbi:phosphonate ABC transporter substrate-binding protein [Klebsiella pneumoniae]|uniref:Phosphonate ABC transporter substrate-binding protein n=1 Tax=Klebsiella pneumoniae TaxID=573 RepID=A0A2X3FWQ1_KLEPN|nr:phosphonate ABC transporter substrate-binding protein [Klebsiella pneumoniae]